MQLRNWSEYAASSLTHLDFSGLNSAQGIVVPHGVDASPSTLGPPLMTRRRLGHTDLWVSPVALGCWPIAGITSIGVTEADSLATIAAALDAGINFFDTAYCYGYDGESEKLVGRVLRPHRKEVVIATKCGIHWGRDQKQVKDARPETLRTG